MSAENKNTCETVLCNENNNFCKEISKRKMHNIPENISCITRDQPYIDCWLTPQYQERMKIIRKQVKCFADQYHQNETSLSYYTPHDVSHCEAVENNIYKVIAHEYYALLSEHERFYLIASAWLHDIGMYYESFNDCIKGESLRAKHHIYSGIIISEHYTLLGVEFWEVDILSTLARFHRKKEDINTCPEIMSANSITLRIQLLASYLRLADALHLDQTRTPPSAHAVALTYDMPYYSKIHWVRSRLVTGIDIDPKKSILNVHLKYPRNNIDTVESVREFNRKLYKIYNDFIIQELKDELDSVKDIFIENNITFYNKVEYTIHKVPFGKGLFEEILLMINSDLSIRRPSSTVLYTSTLDTVRCHIIKYKEAKGKLDEKERVEGEEHTIKNIKRFIDEQKEKMGKEKKCHFQLRSFLTDMHELLDENTRKKKIECLIKKLNSKSKEYKKNTRSNVSTLMLSELYEHIANFKSSKNNLLYFLFYYIHALKVMSKIDMQLIRQKASLYIKKISSGKQFGYERMQIDAMVNAIASEILSENIFSVERRYENKAKVAYKGVKIPSKIGIILYGYSTTVLKSICGFRDAIYHKVMKELSKKNKKQQLFNAIGALLQENNGANFIERRISERFEIFVCEAQPKNIVHGDRVHYHDGLEYIEALNKRGFINTVLIADAICGTLLTQYYDVAIKRKKIEQRYKEFEEAIKNIAIENKKDNRLIFRFPRINFLMIGVNGFSNNYLYHSAGHLSSIHNAFYKGRTKVVVAVQTGKYNPRNKNNRVRHLIDRSIPLENPMVKEHEAFKSYFSYKGEKVRSSTFTTTNNKYFNSIQRHEMKDVTPYKIYTPAEDAIRFYDIDVIITENYATGIEKIVSRKNIPAIYSHGPKQHIETSKSYPKSSFLKRKDFKKFGKKVWRKKF